MRHLRYTIRQIRQEKSFGVFQEVPPTAPFAIGTLDCSLFMARLWRQECRPSARRARVPRAAVHSRGARTRDARARGSLAGPRARFSAIVGGNRYGTRGRVAARTKGPRRRAPSECGRDGAAQCRRTSWFQRSQSAACTTSATGSSRSPLVSGRARATARPRASSSGAGRAASCAAKTAAGSLSLVATGATVCLRIRLLTAPSRPPHAFQGQRGRPAPARAGVSAGPAARRPWRYSSRRAGSRSDGRPRPRGQAGGHGPGR
jgi:hypothetical protein